MNKLSVCILFGGISPEHEVSLRSAESVLKNMDPAKYNIFPVGITKEGKWILFGGQDYSELPAGTWMYQDDSEYRYDPDLARQLLAESRIPIGAVAAECGFESLSSFRRTS
mgnify:CR=1 FL=1